MVKSDKRYYNTRMNMRFGLYLIPKNGEFYQAGSSVVGYDIRAQQPVTPPDFIDQAWISTNTQYGFHATITDAIIADEQKIPEIIARTAELLGSLKPDNRYILTKLSVGFWPVGSGQAAMVMQPNRNTELLHDVLVTALHPMGSGSDYTQTARDFGTDAANNKTKLFHSPYILDNFVPHFTYIASYAGTEDEREAVEDGLKQLFADVNEIEFDTIAFVVQREGEQYFHIEREFSLHGEQ